MKPQCSIGRPHTHGLKHKSSPICSPLGDTYKGDGTNSWINFHIIKSPNDFWDVQCTSGSLTAQSLKNTDCPNIHLGPHRLSWSSSCSTSAAANLGACYSQSLLSSGPGAGGHPVVLSVGRWGWRDHTLVCGRELAQSLEHTTLGGGEAIGSSRGGGGGRSVWGRWFEFASEAPQGGAGWFCCWLFLLRGNWFLENAGVLEDRAFVVAVKPVVYVHVSGYFARRRPELLFHPSVQAAEHTGGLPNMGVMSTNLLFRHHTSQSDTQRTFMMSS